MGNNVVGGKNLGLLGIFTAIVYTAGLFCAVFTMSDFEIGVDNINDLGSETIYIFGCSFAGILGIMFGVGMIIAGNESGVLVSKIRGIILTLTAITLVVVGASKCDETVVLVLEVLIIIAAICEIASCWVLGDVIKTLIALIFAVVLVCCFAMNLIVGFGFAIFAAIWVFIMSFFIFAEACQPDVPNRSGSKSEKKKTKKQKMANKSASKVKQVPAKIEVAKEDNRKLKSVESSVEPKDEKQKSAKIAPTEEQPKEQRDEQSKAESIPKLKVMSSKEAAAVRQAKKEASAESSRLESVAKVESMPVYTDKSKEEPLDINTDQSGDTSDYDMVESEPDTPGALVRRAAWNKGLRCRRDYGSHSIPVAFVKGKVAVFVTAVKEDTSIDSVLESEGWTVLRYLESDVTDGKVQGAEIAKVVKDNLRAERATKKKKQKSKR